jgi:subtilisin family serine protease
MNNIQSQPAFSMADLRSLTESFEGIRPRATAPGDALQDVLVLAPQARREAGFRDLAGTGAKVRDVIDEGAVTARVSSQQAGALSQMGYRLIDDSPRELLPKLPAGNGKWDCPEVDPVKMTHADDLHKQGFTGKGTVAAVLDSGFDYPDYNPKVLKWDDVVNHSPSFHDGAGHGTHVVSDILKTAPDTGIVAIKVMGDNGEGRPSDIIKGLQAVARLKQGGMNITSVNMSLGGDLIPGLLSKDNPIDQAVDKLHEMGIAVVAAAGNSGHETPTLGSPAEALGAIAVGSVLNPTTMSVFSSGGPTVDGKLKPDFDAPGEFIKGWTVPYSELYKVASVVQSLRDMSGARLKALLKAKPDLAQALKLPADLASKPASAVEEAVKSTLPPVFLTPDGQLAAPGTSFAAPLATGVVNALEQAGPLSPDRIKAALKSSAHKVGKEPANVQGAGLIDAGAALKKLQA